MPKLGECFKNDDFIDKESTEQCGGNEDIDMTKCGSIVEPDNSEYLTPDQQQLDKCKTQSEAFFYVEKVRSLPYVTDKGYFKELNDEVNL